MYMIASWCSLCLHFHIKVAPESSPVHAQTDKHGKNENQWKHLCPNQSVNDAFMRTIGHQ